MLKINGKEVTATEFAFDGCHKIYLIATPEDRARMVECGYYKWGDILPISELSRAWDISCPLRFIRSADLETQYVEQCDDAEVTWSA